MSKEKIYSSEAGNIDGSSKDAQSITSDWQKIQKHIIGVETKIISTVIKDNGSLTEIFRQEWFKKTVHIDQIFHVTLNPGEISGWHSHQFTEDRLFTSLGTIKTVLFDARTDSPTFNHINEFRSGSTNPMLIIVPPGVWHAIQNIDTEKSIIINFTDQAYNYNDPDHWRLPVETDKIPYSFNKRVKKGNF